MVVAGERRIDAVAVVAADDRGPTSPCGACRQVLREFGGSDVPVVSEHAQDGSRNRWTLGELLPAAFEL
jgi:cytidine deaminase